MAATVTCGLNKGDDLPIVKLKDINGNSLSSDDGKDGLQLVSFAGKESSERLKWMDSSAIALAKEFPEEGVKCSSIAIADVAGIPYLVQFPVEKILRMSVESSTAEGKKKAQEAGVRELFSSHCMVPDWEGKYLPAFKVSGSAQYVIIIVFKGKIEAILIESENIQEEYNKIMKELLSQ